MEHFGKPTVSQRLADAVTDLVGSWKFVLCQTAVIVIWMLWNDYFSGPRFDPYPFVFLNLILSFQAAYTAPFIMMSQNRLAEQDRLISRYNYEITKLSNEELKLLLTRMEAQNKMILKLIIHLGLYEKIDDDDGNTH